MRKEISSVCVGAFGDFRDLDKFIGPYRNLFDGVEMIGIGGGLRIRTLLSQAEALGYRVLTIHGQTLGPDHAANLTEAFESRVYSTAIIDTPNLIRDFSLQHDILVHAPNFRDPENYRALRANLATIGVIWIENHHSGREGLKEMFGVVDRIRSEFGIDAKAKIDLAHYMNPHLTGKGFATAWRETMGLFSEGGIVDSQQDVRGRKLPVGVHFEFGEAEDSLPITDGLSDEMLAESLVLMHERGVEAVTIELHPGYGLGLFKPMGRDLVRRQRRSGVIFDRLQKIGVL